MYDTLPEAGRALQRHFYALLRHGLPSLPTVAGEVFVVVPARNEEKYIRDTLDHLCAGTNPARFQIAVIVNATTDATEARVRAWAAEHADTVELVDHVRQPDSHDPRRHRVHLLDEPTPGKPLAMFGVDRIFQQRGAYPEWIAQVDADTRVAPGALDHLIEHATLRGEVAKTGDVHWRQRDGAEAIIVVPPDPTGWRWQGLLGNFLVARTRVWLAGLRTLLEACPQSIGEDGLMSTLIRLGGLRTGSATDPGAIPYVTLSPSTEEEAFQQQVRWWATNIQLVRLFGRDAIEAVGLISPRTDPAVQPAQGPVGKSRFLEMYKAALEAVQRAEATRGHAWIPGRTSATDDDR